MPLGQLLLLVQPVAWGGQVVTVEVVHLELQLMVVLEVQVLTAVLVAVYLQGD